MKWYRPTRGAVRLEGLSFDVAALQEDLNRFESRDWRAMNYGDQWGRIDVCKDEYRHPRLAECPAIQQVLEAFPAPVFQVWLARLGPGGWVKEHRDISGGVPMGVARFHVPVVTHRDVEFYVNGLQLYMGPGEVWSLDTSYRHKLNNRSSLWRVHLIVDVRMNETIKSMLPGRDWRDAVHQGCFWLICCGKGLSHLTRPRRLLTRLKQVFRVGVLKKSTLT